MSDRKFSGFSYPQSNFTRIPNEFFDLLPVFGSKAEFAIVLYVIRHTWGFQEFDEGKRITVDEFMYGRKKRDGSRLDNGTGLSAPSVRRGIAAAVEHGFLEVEVDDSDAARIEKYYTLKMVGEQSVPPDGTERSIGGKRAFHRTEKETLKRNGKNGAARRTDDTFTY